jgi:hypothetical protein
MLSVLLCFLHGRDLKMSSGVGTIQYAHPPEDGQRINLGAAFCTGGDTMLTLFITS